MLTSFTMTNAKGWTYQQLVRCGQTVGGAKEAEKIANGHPEHGKHGPWTAGHCTRAA